MAGRVNVKFVVALSAVLLLVFAGVVGAVVWVLDKSGEDYANAARQLETEGEWKKAARNWARAVRRDQDNIEYLESWFAAQQKVQPENPLEYAEHFDSKYYAILRQIAEVKQTDIEAHEKHLDIQKWRLQSSVSLEVEESFIREVERVLAMFTLDPNADASQGDYLRWYRGASIVKLMTIEAQLGGTRPRADQPWPAALTTSTASKSANQSASAARSR